MGRMIFVAIMTMALLACVGVPVNWDSARQLKAGMTEDQAIAIMGPPQSVEPSADFKRIIWRSSDLLTGAHSNLELIFVGGKLRDIPRLPGDPPPPDPDENLPHVMVYATRFSSNTQEFATKTLCKKVLGQLVVDAFLKDTRVITSECIKK